jgi:hypothetical protein
MSLRAIAQMKRENRELRYEVGAVKNNWRSTQIVKLNLSSVEDGMIQTAQKLGFVTTLRDNHDGSFSVYAMKLEHAE